MGAGVGEDPTPALAPVLVSSAPSSPRPGDFVRCGWSGAVRDEARRFQKATLLGGQGGRGWNQEPMIERSPAVVLGCHGPSRPRGAQSAAAIAKKIVSARVFCFAVVFGPPFLFRERVSFSTRVEGFYKTARRCAIAVTWRSL